MTAPAPNTDTTPTIANLELMLFNLKVNNKDPIGTKIPARSPADNQQPPGLIKIGAEMTGHNPGLYAEQAVSCT